MPFKSEKQRRYLHAKHPDIAARWEAEGKKKPPAAKGKRGAKARSRDRGKG